MSERVIRVEQLGKRFRIGRHRGPYRTLRDAVRDAAVGTVRRARAVLRGQAAAAGQQDFWALRDVSFEVGRGEVVGVIGRNGAGKSTLLKILSRITEPSEGEVRLRGRVGALLEVGTGFHPELTGRDNIYLNGALLGMPRADIRRRFDAIVDFAEMGQFIDTPVKHYSSGMYMRLAFAVAAHLEPEILVVDEVLAVGDLKFQRKCVTRMGEVAKENRTVLFVSHNMALVRSLCTRGIMLHAGAIAFDGPATQAANAYTDLFASNLDVSGQGLADRRSRTSGAVRITRFEVAGAGGPVRWAFEPGETIALTVRCKAQDAVPGLGLYVGINSALTKEPLTSIKTPILARPLAAGEETEIRLVLPDICLRPGEYQLYIAIGTPRCDQFFDVIDNNISMPNLVVTSAETDLHHLAGYFSLPWRLESPTEVG